ncbi:hypothetical protein AF389_25100, partial [Salmonella enterica subsp. enterica serovar Typhimurium]
MVTLWGNYEGISQHKAVNAYKQVFPVDGKVPELCTTIKFFKEWFSAEHINRGLLVKEWAERL